MTKRKTVGDNHDGPKKGMPSPYVWVCCCNVPGSRLRCVFCDHDHHRDCIWQMRISRTEWEKIKGKNITPIERVEVGKNAATPRKISPYKGQ